MPSGIGQRILFGKTNDKTVFTGFSSQAALGAAKFLSRPDGHGIRSFSPMGQKTVLCGLDKNTYG